MIPLTSVSPTWYVDESTMYIGYFWLQIIGHITQGVVWLGDNNIIKWVPLFKLSLLLKNCSKDIQSLHLIKLEIIYRSNYSLTKNVPDTKHWPNSDDIIYLLKRPNCLLLLPKSFEVTLTFSVMTLSISIKSCYVESHNTECRIFLLSCWV